MREKNAIKMKARWDTKNTQKFAVGDFVLVDPQINKTKKIKQKRILGESIYSLPGIVLEVNAIGNIRVEYKNGDVTPIDRPVPNNQFKVIDQITFNSIEMKDEVEIDGEEVEFGEEVVEKEDRASFEDVYV
jgi:hypothetical protein